VSWEATCWCGRVFKGASSAAVQRKWEEHFDECAARPLHERGVHALTSLAEAGKGKSTAKPKARTAR
jgi:hypothetical protein